MARYDNIFCFTSLGFPGVNNWFSLSHSFPVLYVSLGLCVLKQKRSPLVFKLSDCISSQIQPIRMKILVIDLFPILREVEGWKHTHLRALPPDQHWFLTRPAARLPSCTRLTTLGQVLISRLQ